ncbi:tetratricopeptide repeat protein [uncultured Gimesia sp.]|uniref:tetratricopeptide repeat protein n=1 Tax=uncultured Gimesia sp. TaxID=1678688 RepID=UPI002614089B|nr:tetratricopeptide repeat protein [uncultured Gimesia sp.]
MNETFPQNISEVDTTQLSAKTNLFGVALLYLVVVLLVFSQCLSYPLLDWDDNLHLSENPNLNPVSLSGIWNIWSQPYEGLYIPLSYSFFAIEVSLTRLFGFQENAVLAPYIFHGGSLLLHLANSLLVYRILNFIVNDNRAACLGGLLFVLHPLQVESVVWISETRGLLSNFFSLATIYFTLRYVKQFEISPSDPKPSTVIQKWKSNSELMIATICLLLSMLAKPSSVITPLIIGILVYVFCTGYFKKLRAWIFSWLMIALVMILINRGEQSDLLFESPFWARPFIVGDALAFYFQKLFLPAPLVMQYDKSIKLILNNSWIYWSWLIPCLIILLACISRQRRIWMTAIAIFIVGLLPVLGLIPFAYQFVSTVADRYVYLSMLGPALGIAWLLRDAQKAVVLIFTCTVLFFCAGLSFIQTATWADSSALYQHCLAYNPRAFIVLNNLGHLSFKAKKYEKALYYFEQAIEVLPDDLGTNQNLGATYKQLGDINRAVKYYHQALKIDPKYPKAHIALGVYYESTKQNKKALHHYQQAIQAQPQNIVALHGLGNLARVKSQFKEALRYYQLALKFNPDALEVREALGNLYLEMGDVVNAEQQFELSRKQGFLDPVNEFNLGLIAAKNADLQKAVQHYESALQSLSPEKLPDLYKQVIQELTFAYNLLGTKLQQKGNHRQAEKYFQLAVKTSPDFAPAYFNLGESLYRLGKTKAAIDALQTALKMVPPGSEPARDIQNRIDLYQNK